MRVSLGILVVFLLAKSGSWACKGVCSEHVGAALPAARPQPLRLALARYPALLCFPSFIRAMAQSMAGGRGRRHVQDLFSKQFRTNQPLNMRRKARDTHFWREDTDSQ